MAATARSPCMFCQIARSATSTELLYADDKVVAFRDINPSALREGGYFSSVVSSSSTEAKIFPPRLSQMRQQNREVRRVVEIRSVTTVALGVVACLFAHLGGVSSKIKEASYHLFLAQVQGSLKCCHISERHYLVIPVDHIPTVKDLQRRTEDHQLVNQMLNVGKNLLARDAPESPQYRFGFHQPPFNSVDHLHLHCLALPFIPSWRSLKYRSLGPFGGFIEAEKLIDKLKPLSSAATY